MRQRGGPWFDSVQAAEDAVHALLRRERLPVNPYPTIVRDVVQAHARWSTATSEELSGVLRQSVRPQQGLDVRLLARVPTSNSSQHSALASNNERNDQAQSESEQDIRSNAPLLAAGYALSSCASCVDPESAAALFDEADALVVNTTKSLSYAQIRISTGIAAESCLAQKLRMLHTPIKLYQLISGNANKMEKTVLAVSKLIQANLSRATSATPDQNGREALRVEYAAWRRFRSPGSSSPTTNATQDKHHDTTFDVSDIHKRPESFQSALRAALDEQRCLVLAFVRRNDVASGARHSAKQRRFELVVSFQLSSHKDPGQLRLAFHLASPLIFALAVFQDSESANEALRAIQQEGKGSIDDRSLADHAARNTFVANPFWIGESWLLATLLMLCALGKPEMAISIAKQRNMHAIVQCAAVRAELESLLASSSRKVDVLAWKHASSNMSAHARALVRGSTNIPTASNVCYRIMSVFESSGPSAMSWRVLSVLRCIAMLGEQRAVHALLAYRTAGAELASLLQATPLSAVFQQGETTHSTMPGSSLRSDWFLDFGENSTDTAKRQPGHAAQVVELKADAEGGTHARQCAASAWAMDTGLVAALAEIHHFERVFQGSTLDIRKVVHILYKAEWIHACGVARSAGASSRNAAELPQSPDGLPAEQASASRLWLLTAQNTKGVGFYPAIFAVSLCEKSMTFLYQLQNCSTVRKKDARCLRLRSCVVREVHAVAHVESLAQFASVQAVPTVFHVLSPLDSGKEASSKPRKTDGLSTIQRAAASEVLTRIAQQPIPSWAGDGVPLAVWHADGAKCILLETLADIDSAVLSLHREDPPVTVYIEYVYTEKHTQCLCWGFVRHTVMWEPTIGVAAFPESSKHGEVAVAASTAIFRTVESAQLIATVCRVDSHMLRHHIVDRAVHSARRSVAGGQLLAALRWGAIARMGERSIMDASLETVAHEPWKARHIYPIRTASLLQSSVEILEGIYATLGVRASAAARSRPSTETLLLSWGHARELLGRAATTSTLLACDVTLHTLLQRSVSDCGLALKSEDLFLVEQASRAGEAARNLLSIVRVWQMLQESIFASSVLRADV